MKNTKSEYQESEVIIRAMKLIDFLSKVLDENYELVLHSFRRNRKEGNIIAIKNGYISGRKLGDGVLPEEKEILRRNAYLYSNDIINYGANSLNGESLVCSALFLGEKGREPFGVFSINRKYETARNDTIGNSVSAMQLASSFGNQNNLRVVSLSSVNEEMTKAVVEVTNGIKNNPEQLTVKERISAITLLKTRGVFEMKNAIKIAADFFKVSKPTVYRYLQEAV